MMNRILAVLLVLGYGSVAADQTEVLMVADEFPAMRVLASAWEGGGVEPRVRCRIVGQEELPDELEPFHAVVVYIHRELKPGPEQAFIQYARGGGRLVLLHHSISSGKRKNRDWFGFLGVELPLGDVRDGGYQWREGVPLQVYRVREHYITTHGIDWPEETAGPAGESRPAVTFQDSEVYLNHVLHGPHTALLGLRYAHPETGATYTQETAGWYRRTGSGWLFYFMPGHSENEFQSPVYRQILLNTLRWQPDPA